MKHVCLCKYNQRNIYVQLTFYYRKTDLGINFPLECLGEMYLYGYYSWVRVSNTGQVEDMGPLSLEAYFMLCQADRVQVLVNNLQYAFICIPL